MYPRFAIYARKRRGYSLSQLSGDNALHTPSLSSSINTRCIPAQNAYYIKFESKVSARSKMVFVKHHR